MKWNNNATYDEGQHTKANVPNITNSNKKNLHTKQNIMLL